MEISGNPGYASSDLEGFEWYKSEKSQRLFFDSHLQVSKNPKIIKIRAGIMELDLIQNHHFGQKSEISKIDIVDVCQHADLTGKAGEGARKGGGRGRGRGRGRGQKEKEKGRQKGKEESRQKADEPGRQ